MSAMLEYFFSERAAACISAEMEWGREQELAVLSCAAVSCCSGGMLSPPQPPLCTSNHSRVVAHLLDHIFTAIKC